MRVLGLILIIVSVLWPVPYYWELAAKHDNIALFSQYLGSVSLILMGISQFLATRMKGLETLFGGLDRIYLLHKWLGISAMVAMMFHDTIDAEMDGLGVETFLADAAEESGEIALYGLLILVVISLTTFVPYELWKKTHKFIGAFFAMSAFHYLYILKPFATLDPLGLYITAFCVLGVVSYVYMLLLHGVVERKHPYQISSLDQHHDVFKIRLSPLKKGIKHKAGQFAFLHANQEVHPFTIAAGPQETRELTFYIKQLGDFTQQLGHAYQEGDTVHISRPSGHFTIRKKTNQVWVAGGIGITPFLAWIDRLSEMPDQMVDLFFCVKRRSDLAAFDEQLNHPQVRLHTFVSEEGHRLNLAAMEEILGSEHANPHVFFCGPKALRALLQEKYKVTFEEFEMRSGLSLKFLLPVGEWLMTLILKRINQSK
ncbi:ferric reductase-like transmembrane domain-containing protein [Terasakiella sp. A23]|uniref:ferredoxin reductase family protein n=1 Tax=Terasakiella sp. FCG-A23 TaxID=3080561 RepID=UPI002954EEE5|nr:ferric reductase-like transmembrane domain-containing protein [Terasakiella sp. A23]MDV7340893.1 ferric reductase-like transmembrane domain-containing protein [Terasakiella sp. A23]